MARALNVRALFAKRYAGVLTLRRGFAIRPLERVLVVEDVVTNGGSAVEGAELVRSFGGEVVGFATIVERGDVPQLSPLCSSWQVRPLVFSEADCPLCSQGIPLSKPGSRPMQPTTK